MMNQSASLAEWISSYLSERNTNITALAKKLELKSRNSLQRVCDGVAGKGSLLNVIDSIADHFDDLGLSDEDARILASIRQRVNTGEDYYRFFSSFMKLFTTPADNGSKTTIHGTSEELSYHSIAQENNPISEILVLNSCFPSTVQLLSETLANQESDTTLSIHHYIVKDREQITLIDQLAFLMPVLFAEEYSLYISNERPLGPITDKDKINSIIIRFADEQEALIQFISPEYCMIVQTNNAYEQYHDLFHLTGDTFTRLKTEPHVAQINELQDGYKKLFDDELGKNILEIRPDFCIRFIPYEIMQASFIRAYKRNTNQLPDEQLFGQLEGIVSLHKMRYAAAFSSEQTNSLILSRQQLSEFCRDGMISEKNSNLDSFTIYERLEILCRIYRNAQENPHFQMYLIDDDNLLLGRPIKLNYISYGTEKIRISPIIPETGSLFDDVPVLEIYEKDIIQAFNDFFKYELIAGHTLSRDDTMEFFKEMIIDLASQLYGSLPLDIFGNISGGLTN